MIRLALSHPASLTRLEDLVFLSLGKRVRIIRLDGLRSRFRSLRLQTNFRFWYKSLNYFLMIETLLYRNNVCTYLFLFDILVLLWFLFCYYSSQVSNRSFLVLWKTEFFPKCWILEYKTLGNNEDPKTAKQQNRQNNMVVMLLLICGWDISNKLTMTYMRHQYKTY